jgi:hypothetical protein
LNVTSGSLDPGAENLLHGLVPRVLGATV